MYLHDVECEYKKRRNKKRLLPGKDCISHYLKVRKGMDVFNAITMNSNRKLI